MRVAWRPIELVSEVRWELRSLLGYFFFLSLRATHDQISDLLDRTYARDEKPRKGKGRVEDDWLMSLAGVKFHDLVS